MKRNTQKTLAYFYGHTKRYSKVAVLMIFALIIGTTASMAWPIVFREFLAILSTDQAKTVIIPALITTLLWIMLLEGIEWIGWRTAHYANNYLQSKVMTNISVECFEYLHKHSYRFFTNNFAGALVKKVSRLIRGFERVGDKIYWDLGSMGLRLLIILGTLTYLHPLLGAVMGAWTAIFLAANYLLSRYKFKFDIARSEFDSKVTGVLADTIVNNTNIKLFSGLKSEIAAFTEVNQKWAGKVKKSWDVNAHIEAGQAAFMILLEFTVLYSSIKLWEKDLIQIVDFFLIQTYLLEMFHQLWNFGRHLRDLYEALAESEEMTVILNTPIEIKDSERAKNLAVHTSKVEFKNANFAYSDEESVIKNLSFTIKPGEKIALIGPSGGGKSTIVKLLLRLFDLQKGKILIDNQDISAVTQDSLRKAIALVPQDPILFHRTLMENIRYGNRSATRQEIIAASKMAHCHEFISKFHKSYNTYVGERGIKLSGGQRQRVAIARAILSNAKILILDEATSSLDSESEKLIQDALTNLIKNKTTFIIAHRLSTIMNTDRIFVLDNGRIIEEGTHADLVSKESGLYKKLWNLQIGGYL